MRPAIYLAAVAAVLAAVTIPAAGQVPTKQPVSATVRLVVKPGEATRWRSPNVGAIRSMYVRFDGKAVSYNLQPRTNACVAYIYGSGVVARLTDCANGRRVPYLRVRAVSAALDPVVIRLRLN